VTGVSILARAEGITVLAGAHGVSDSSRSPAPWMLRAVPDDPTIYQGWHK